MKTSAPTWHLLLPGLKVRVPLEAQSWLLLLRFADDDTRLLEGPESSMEEPKIVH